MCICACECIHFFNFTDAFPLFESETSWITTSSEDDEERGMAGMGGQGGTRAHPETVGEPITDWLIFPFSFY